MFSKGCQKRQCRFDKICKCTPGDLAYCQSLKRCKTSTVQFRDFSLVSRNDGLDLTGGARKIFRRLALKIDFLHQPPMHIRHAGFDIAMELELIAAFGNLQCADFTRPFINILKRMAVNSFQMGEIEITNWHAIQCTETTRRRSTRSKSFASRIPGMFLRTRLPGVTIGIDHSAARDSIFALTCARM